MSTHVNKTGYLLTRMIHNDTIPLGVETRTYACTDLAGLHALIYRLTGREAGTYHLLYSGLPSIPNISINHPLHIYSGA